MTVAGVAMVVLVAAGVVAWRVTTAQRTDPLRPAADGIGVLFTDLPAQLRRPAQVADLPTDRAVGQGVLIYHAKVDASSYDPTDRTFDQNDVYLVTRSGGHFRLGRTPEVTGPLNLSLSPDGRWLGAKRDGRWRVRDLSGTTEHEVADGYELWRWSTDARSLLLFTSEAEGRVFATMALPGGDVRLLNVRTSPVGIEVAFIAGRELAVFDANPLVDPSATQQAKINLKDVLTGASRTLPVVGPGQLRPGEAFGPIFVPWHAGGSPPTIWMEVGRPDLVPTDSPEGPLVVPSVALLGVDVTSGAPTARIEMPSTDADGRQRCLGVVDDGVVLQRWTASSTELVVVDPRSGTRRVVTTFPETVTVLVPGALV
ncbi:TolB family protein [Micromonospora sp. LH3U1]|uniref:TolB family protein n=1 Tax=Micromonospora sp. LH3U1 TaxID=3018339 RepID=UPI002349DD38|nr:hypothetical protein [Micromonospora sp. LH3U1]WCN79722.1 hypothetical protein PCA76_22405 [Micromonospora sp. LH3U1]